MIRRVLLTLVGLLVFAGMSGVERWPDGSEISSWFSGKERPLKGREARRFMITEYGALQDSSLLQTEAIQRTIDAAAVSGGTVVIPKGTWRSGALFFKPRTHLLLEEGAVLKGSTDIADYPFVPVHIEGVLQPYAAALVNADRCDGFSMAGSGTLDGAGLPFWKAFWDRRKENPACTNLEVLRPRLVSISGSSDISLSGVRLRDAGFWNVHLYKCRRVRISDLSIEAPVEPVKAPSSDGVDLDACSDVHIRNCSFATGDDLIAVKGGKGPWADQDPDNGTNERILVEDCYFGHGPGALVFGSECVGAENVILRRCKAEGTDRLIWLKMRPDTPQKYAHILVEEVAGEVGSVLFVRPWTQFFDLKGRKDIPMSYASDLKIQRCTLRCERFRNVRESPGEYAMEGIVFKDNKFRYNYNQDESRVRPYSLEDPLTFADGRPVTSPAEWRERRREILALFEREMYGVMPPPVPIFLKTLEEGLTMGETVLRRQVRMTFSEDGSGPFIDWLILYPQHAEGPVPAVIALNFYGNHTVLPDPEIRIPTCSVDEQKERGAFSGRGTDTVFPVDEMASRGYAFVTACYEEVSPDPEDLEDQDSMAWDGIFHLWKRDPARTDNTGSLMAWAWALCRGMDMLEQDGKIDASKVVLTGCSRLGKAAIVAGAFDERFAVVVPNQTGGGGVPLSKRNFGESVGTETEKFTHWWCKAFSKYAGAEKTMPFDQHLLLSCVAPRPLLVEGFNNPWFDTYGEFLSLRAASPVWTFLGGTGLPEVPWPDNYDTSAIGKDMGYVRRLHGHGLSSIDWKWLLDFADQAMGRNR